MALETSVSDDVEKSEEDADSSEVEEANSESDEQESKKKKLSDRWKRSAPGKLPPRNLNQAKDSREAAADMLKRFFNRG
jgi:hypothetical protein